MVLRGDLAERLWKGVGGVGQCDGPGGGAFEWYSLGLGFK